MFRIICIFIGYLIGCFQSAYFIGKIFAKIDIRDYGSKNAGATNTFRILGLKTAILVFTIDILKCILAYLICSYLFNGGGNLLNTNNLNILPGLYSGLGIILGHSFPFYLNFKGGKGASCLLSIIFCINVKMAIILFITGVTLIFFTKYSALSSLIVTFIFPFFIFKYSKEAILISFLISFILFYLHKDNIKRILKGTENKIYFIKKRLN